MNNKIEIGDKVIISNPYNNKYNKTKVRTVKKINNLFGSNFFFLDELREPFSEIELSLCENNFSKFIKKLC